jgi:hypothetical protein
MGLDGNNSIYTLNKVTLTEEGSYFADGIEARAVRQGWRGYGFTTQRSIGTGFTPRVNSREG